MTNKIKEYIETVKTFPSDTVYYLLGNFIAGFGFSGFMLLFNLYLKNIGIGESIIGRILSVGTYATVIFIFPAAFLIRKIPFKPILILIPILTSTGYAIALSFNSLHAIMIGIFIAGSMGAFGSVIGGPFIMQNSSPLNRTHIFSINQVTMLLSGITGNIVAGIIPKILTSSGIPLSLGYKIAIFIHIAIAACASFIYAKISTFQLPKSETPFFHIHTDWKILLKIAIPPMIVGLGAGMTVPFLNLYFRTRFDFPPHFIGFLFAAGGLFTSLGSLYSPIMASKYGKIKSVIISQLVSVPFLIVLGISYNVWISIIAFLSRNALMNMAQPLVTNVSMEMVNKHDRSLTSGIISVSWLATWGITANIGGYIIEHYGYMIPFMITSLLYIISSVLYYYLLLPYDKNTIDGMQEKV